MYQAIGGAGADLLQAVDSLRELKVERERADYDRISVLTAASARQLLGDASRIVKLFSSPRVKDADVRVYLALVALKA